MLINPLWMNEIMKTITSSPRKYDRDAVLKLLENPIYNEKALKDLHQYLLNNSQHYKRTLYYFATMLTFDYVVIPLNVDEKDMKSGSFKRAQQKVYDWLEELNPKDTFTDIMRVIMGEDAAFYYLRELEDGTVYLQRMPTDYCKIVNKTRYGWQYAFNMVYFARPGVNIRDFAPEFEIYWREFLEGDKNIPFFWKILDPAKAYVFKWDEMDAAILLPLMGLFLDAIEIMEFKALLKTKTALENYKILFHKIPMRQDKDAKKNDYLIDAVDAGKFHANISSKLPPGASVLTTPMEITPINFEGAETRTNIVGAAEENYFGAAGTSPNLFGAATKSSAGLSLNIKVDENVVFPMQNKFERFINLNLKRISPKYRFKVKFLGITNYNRDEKFNEYMKAAQGGLPKTLVGASLGLSPYELDSLLKYENAFQLISEMQVLPSSHVQSPTNSPGRPTQTQVTEKGEEWRDNQV